MNEVEELKLFVDKYNLLKKEVGKVIVGQDDVVKGVITAIFSNGHVILVGVPGLAKTLLVNTIAGTLGLSYNRIQFTPDLMPSDIIGSEILSEDRKLKFYKGPIFSNIILADEINRTPPKTQAALLEAMQERAITVNGTRYKLDEPFFVLATQNPIEQEGTYPLPEAQLDRFMFNIVLDYPSYQEEVDILKNTTGKKEVVLNKIFSADEIAKYQDMIRRLPVTDNVYNYAVGLVTKTRPKTERADKLTNEYLSWGAGPRASQFLIHGAKCNAAINGRYSPDIDDVKAVAHNILRHRIVRNYRAEADGIKTDYLISEFLK